MNPFNGIESIAPVDFPPALILTGIHSMELKDTITSTPMLA